MSAYLHSATMVKAGIVLIGVMHPVLGAVDIWSGLGVTVGLLTMFWGAIGALRHADAKLVLAWGTVSQLGLMTAMMSLGSGKAIFAAVSLVVAHAVFKAALFMAVGEIDIRTGSRDLRSLSGLRTSMPVAFWVMVFAGLSMAGVPPLLGFPAKEAAIEASLKESGASGDLILAGVTIGSVLTVAYTTRLVLALFSDKGGESTEVAPFRWAAAAPSVLLSALGVVGYAWRPVSPTGSCRPPPRSKPRRRGTRCFGGRASTARPSGSRWASSPVVRSSGGSRSPFVAARTGRCQQCRPARRPHPRSREVDHRPCPARLTADLSRRDGPRGLACRHPVPRLDRCRSAPRLGSSVAGGMGTTVVAAAIAVAAIRSRIGAAPRSAWSASAYPPFSLSRGPDLALTQLLVETVIVVGFVIGLGGLTTQFPANGFVWRSVRIGTAVLAGAAVTVALLASAEDTRPTVRHSPLRRSMRAAATISST